MLIYYMHSFQEEVPKVAAMMRDLNLLDEAKYFMEFEEIRGFLDAFYTWTGEIELYKSVEDDFM